MQEEPLEFPKDNGGHESIIEWWYFNGRLKDHRGNEYAFMDCLFKANPLKINIPFLKVPLKQSRFKYIYFAHSVISDITKQKSYKEIQDISFLSNDSFKRPLLYLNYFNPLNALNGYCINEISEVSPKAWHIKTELIDLTLESKKQPMLEGGQGFIRLNGGRESYYYSLTNLQTKGLLKINGEWLEVQGKSWLDHQWADVGYGKDKWTWFSIQLDDGTDIMCVEYDTGKEKTYIADVISSKNKSSHFDSFDLKPGKTHWRSEKTKANYPLEWSIEIPEAGISIKTGAVMRDQEMIFGSINYWEGPINIIGISKGKKVKGIGFMELVGFPSDYNALILTGKEFSKKITSQIKKLF